MDRTTAGPTERFTDRVEDYARYRPGYPDATLELLAAECGLGPGCAVADVGAGTGIWTACLLASGARVFALEPNRAMRRAGRERLPESDRMRWLDGTAEATGLPNAAVGLVTAAQAFHWFDRGATRRELGRILAPGGHLAVIWNERRKRATPFLAAYEDLLLEWAIDYRSVDHTRIGRQELGEFFAPAAVGEARFANHQGLDLAGLEGRLRSSSYAPPPDHPGHRPMMAAARRIFELHQRHGRVTIDYDTRVYYGRLR